MTREHFRLVCCAQLRDRDIDFEIATRRALIERKERKFPMFDGARALALMRVLQRHAARDEIEEILLAERPWPVKLADETWKAVKRTWRSTKERRRAERRPPRSPATSGR